MSIFRREGDHIRGRRPPVPVCDAQLCRTGDPAFDCIQCVSGIYPQIQTVAADAGQKSQVGKVPELDCYRQLA